MSDLCHKILGMYYRSRTNNGEEKVEQKATGIDT